MFSVPQLSDVFCVFSGPLLSVVCSLLSAVFSGRLAQRCVLCVLWPPCPTLCSVCSPPPCPTLCSVCSPPPCPTLCSVCSPPPCPTLCCVCSLALLPNAVFCVFSTPLPNAVFCVFSGPLAQRCVLCVLRPLAQGCVVCVLWPPCPTPCSVCSLAPLPNAVFCVFSVPQRCVVCVQVDISKVVTLCKLLEALLFPARGGPDMNADPMKLHVLICTTFVFSYIWSVGGNLLEKYWDAFDTFTRNQFEDNGEAKVRAAGTGEARFNAVLCLILWLVRRGCSAL